MSRNPPNCEYYYLGCPVAATSAVLRSLLTPDSCYLRIWSIQRAENERLRRLRMLSVSEEEAVSREREAFVRGCRHATAYRHEDPTESEEASWKEVAAHGYPLTDTP